MHSKKKYIGATLKYIFLLEIMIYIFKKEDYTLAFQLLIDTL